MKLRLPMTCMVLAACSSQAAPPSAAVVPVSSARAIETTAPVEPAAQAPLDAPDCARPGVRFTLAGEEAFAPVEGPRDLAGHKYRKDGSRSPWLTVNGGPLYVHGVGDYQPGDVGTTRLVLVTVMKKGEHGGYALARDGESRLDVTASDGRFVQGRFEADVSKVADTTRTPPPGTAVVRLRGTFCLPALPADPSDTGP